MRWPLSRSKPIRRPGRRCVLTLETLEDRVALSGNPLTARIAYQVTTDWGSGFGANVSITNTQSAAITSWDLEFDFARSITTIWNATVVSHVGTHYVIAPAAWNGSIAAGATVSFGFNGDPGGAGPGPANYLLTGTLAGAAGTGTGGPTGGTVTTAQAGFAFTVTSDWGSGFGANLAITNKQATPINNWGLAFDFAPTIGSIWNASVVSHVGNHYVLAPASWDAVIAPGATVTVGFNGSPGNVTGGPTNYVLTADGSTGGPTGGPVNHPPVTVNDTAATLQGQPVRVAVLANDSDPDGDPLTVTAVTAGQHGTATANADGTVTYTPAAGFVGTDAFTYTIGDGRGGTATGTATVAVSAATTTTAWPHRVFAPYVDVTAWPTFDFVGAAQTQGVKYFTLAFVVADGTNQPSWGGYPSYDVAGSSFSTTLATQINALRALGGDVMVSFGGAANQELAQVDRDVPTLQAAYQSVINAYGLTHIDFDIEGAAVADHASIDRRSQAIAGLERAAAAAGRDLQVWFTLPVLPTGLTPDGLYVLQSALHYGVTIGGVNVMAMDYGDGAAPAPQGRMGAYAVQAATGLFGQLRGLYGAGPTDAALWHLIGVTPMIGLNDVTTEVFTQQDAQVLLAFAEQHDLGELAMWSLNRDRQDPAGALGYVSGSSSSLVQSPFAFARIFEGFTG